MVYLPPPQNASGARRSYGEAYNNILKTHRRSPSTSASSVVMLVAPDVDALCAARMLVDLFKQDDVTYRVIPVSGINELENVVDELKLISELHTVIMLNMGNIHDLPAEEWFGGFDLRVTVHVIDSRRPINLSSLFQSGENGERILVWDDGGVESLKQEKESWETIQYEPEPDSDDEDEEEDTQMIDEEDYESEAGPSSKRRSLGDGHGDTKRRKTRRMTRDEYDDHNELISKYYTAGSWHSQGAAATIYILATVLERVDTELLWLAILGLTFQYTRARISRQKYDILHDLFHDEVFRLNPPPPPSDRAHLTRNPDDQSIRVTQDLRFTLYRHWNLYDSMVHSSYVASKLGIWQEKGRKKLTGLLAKIGFSIGQTQQPYAHMDVDLKKTLVQKLTDVAPEYGMVELSYPSFMHCYGFKTQPLSAADAVEGVGALLDVAAGVPIEVEIEGARNGGEWFGNGKMWQTPKASTSVSTKKRKDEERENLPPGGEVVITDGKLAEVEEDEDKSWVQNFWLAFDSLSDIDALRGALNLSMALYRSIIRQGTSIIEKRGIRQMRTHHVVVLTQGPDLHLFAHPGVLSRLAMWLVDALRDRMPGISFGRRKGRCLPFVVACLNEKRAKYVVVGVTAAMEMDDVRKNEFGLAFLEASTRCNATTRHGTFDTSVLEIAQDDLKLFLDALSEGPEM